ncbi:MAG: S-layer homology domain-containing protein [Oscillospiraceae bacterium]|nr:S-layer homology domain-containing protein [Oscillospiraceae bacterium]
MFKRITALALCLILALGILPSAEAFGREPIDQGSVDQCCHTLRVDVLSPDYVRPDYEGCLYEITPQRVADHFRYLDEVYVERHPEAALAVNTGDRRDQEVLKTLAETITAGCTTPTEKANAIDRWIARNIYYDVNTSAYAYDVFYNRTGNCLSYANLMQFLLRSLGIPAVVGDGWRGDMKTSTVDLFNYEGHAWCFVYLEGEWVLYDPLWISCGTTDRDYIAEWIYLDTVEFVTPAYDGDNLPPEAWDKPKIYYTDGRWYNFDNSHPNGYGNYTMLVNNQSYNFTPCQDELALGLDGSYDGWYILDGVNDKSGMQLGQLYCNSWLSYGEYANGSYLNLTYAHPNGMQIDGAIMEYDGVERYMHCNTSFPVLAEESDFTMQYGCMAFKPGYVGPFVAPCWGDVYDTDFHIVTWESDTPEVCTVDENGILTALAPGFAQIELTLSDQAGGGYYCITHINVSVSDEVRIPDYTDHAPCSHSYAYSHTVPATCEDWGYEVHICTLCGERFEADTEEPLGHDHSIVTITIPSTCISKGETTYACTRCGDSYTEDLDIDPEAHDWAGTVCTLCGDTRLTPFDDVAEGQFYEEPVAWAVENGITNGTSAATFGSNDQCLRAHVVTFLHRAAENPEPSSTKNPFADVKTSDFFYKPVLWAVEQGITNGVTADKFGAYDVCNRAAVVTFLWRAAGKPDPVGQNNPFTDVAEQDFFYKAVLWAVENGITNGISATEFGPGSSCNRAQVVTFLYRAFGE